MPSPEDIAFDIEQEMMRRGLPQMTPETLKVLLPHLQQPQVQQALYGGGLTVGKIVDEVQAAQRGMRQRGQDRILSPLQGPPQGPTEPGRDALFRSTVPLAQAFGGPMSPGQRPPDATGAASLLAPYDEQQFLDPMRRRLLRGPI